MKMNGFPRVAATIIGCMVLAGCSGSRVPQNGLNSAAEQAGVATVTATESVSGAGATTAATEETTPEFVFSPVERKPLEDLTETGDNTYTCSYDGVGHDFILELPEETEGAPLIVMLHGYGQSASVMKSEVHMEEDAVPKGYAVVYVTGAPDSTDPTSANGWNSGISENENDDVGFIVSLTEYLQDEYGFDKDRTYAAGFSNGAFMMHRLAMDAQDVFSAVVSVCGKMPKSVWDRRYDSNQVGVLQISGEKDDVVPKALDGSATYAYDPGIEDVMQYWADSNGISQCVDESIGKNSTITKYGDAKGYKVWSVMVKDGHHSWYDEGLTGIDVNGLIIEFFEAQTGMPSAD